MGKPKSFFVATVASLYGSCLLVNMLFSCFSKEIVWSFPLAAVIIFLIAFFFKEPVNMGRVSSIIYTIFFLAAAGYYIYVVSSFVGEYVLPRTPKTFFVILLTSLSAYGAHKGYKNILSLGVIFFAAAVVSYAVNGVMLRSSIKPEAFLPLIMNGKNFLWSFLFSFLILFADASVFMSFVKSKKDKSCFALGFLLGSVFLYGVVCFVIMTLPNTASLYSWPVYEALRRVNSGNALARVETASVFVIYAMMFYKICLTFCAAKENFKKFKKSC